MLDHVLESLCWLSLIGLAYIYVGYPCLIWLLARMFPARGVVVTPAELELPTVSVVIVGHNEGRTLPTKVRNLLALHGAERIVEVWIGSDGSTDDTASALASINDPRLHVVEFAERRGKPAGINALVPRCQGEIVLLADARQEFDPSALSKLLQRFADPTIGVVSGELLFRSTSGSTTAEGIGFYWTYEKLIRNAEGRYHGVPGATGAIYALRRELFRPIPEETILDDVAIPMLASAGGHRCVFEPGAFAYDDPAASLEKESIRKRRTIAGNAQLLRLFPGWCLPRWLTRSGHPLWFEFTSHKLARLLSPLLLVSALVTSIALSAAPLYQALLALQLMGYAAALVGWWTQACGIRIKAFGPPLLFLSLNLTTLAALGDALLGRYRVTWRKTT